MKGVEFEEQKQDYNVYGQKVAFLPSLVIKYSRGKVETENQANLVLLVIIAIIFLIVIFIGFSDGSSGNTVKISPEIKEEMRKAGVVMPA